MIATNSFTEQDRARYADKAQGIFSALLALDPDEPSRAHLLASDIGEHRVDALYPKSFQALIPGILRHLGGDIPHTLMAPRISQSSEAMSGMIQSQPRELRARYYADFEAARLSLNPANPPAFPDVYRALTQLWAQSDEAARRMTIALWNAWWLTEHRSEITPEHLRSFADLLLIDVASYMMRDLIPSREPVSF